MDQRNYFKLKGGLNFLCFASGVSILAGTMLKVFDWSEKENKRKEMREAVEAIKTVEKIVGKLDEYTASKTDSEEETK